MKKIRMGVIGAGLAWERLHYPAYQELKDRYEIAAICDPNRARAQKWGGRLGLDPSKVHLDHHELLRREDVDAVDIMVPIELNYQVSEDAARAKKAVICEKPLAPTMDQALQFRELPHKYGVPVMIAENYRYNEENNKIRELIAEDRIGPVVFFIKNKTHCFPEQMKKDTFYSTEWRQHPEYAGGDFLDTALHDLAAMRHVFGAVDSVQAYAVPQDHEFIPYTVIAANIKFKSGVIGQFTYYPDGKEMQRPLLGWRIFGGKGMIYLEEKKAGVINVALNDGSSEQVPYQPERGYYNELVNFHKALTDAESIAVTPEIEFGDVQMVFDILQSIREDRLVSVDAADRFKQSFVFHESEPIHRPDDIVLH